MNALREAKAYLAGRVWSDKWADLHPNDPAVLLAALVEAVEAAPVGRLDIGRNDCDDADMVEIVIDPNRVSHLQYQRVRLLPEMAAEGRDG